MIVLNDEKQKEVEELLTKLEQHAGPFGWASFRRGAAFVLVLELSLGLLAYAIYLLSR